MLKDFEIRGEWTLVGSEIWKAGILYFSQENGGRLEIINSTMENYTFPPSHPIILGKTGIGDITLINCRNSNSHISVFNDFNFQNYSIEYIIQGKHYNHISQLVFKKVDFNLFNFYEWLNISGIEIHQNHKTKGANLSYKKPDSIEFVVTENCKGKIYFEYNGEFRYENGTTISITDFCSIEFLYSVETHFKDILLDIARFQNLLSIMIFEQSYPLYISFFDSEKKSNEESISFFYQNHFFKSHLQITQHILVTYKQIQDLFDEIVMRWFKEYENLRPVLNLILYSFEKKNLFKTDKFLNVIKAIETFHIRTFPIPEIHNSKLMEKFNRIINDIKIPKDKKYIEDLLFERLRPTLNERLTDLIYTYNNNYIEKKILDKVDFSKKSSQSRNYSTHLDPSQKKHALEGKDLYEHYIKLMAILFSSLYMYVGIKKEEFEDKLDHFFY